MGIADGGVITPIVKIADAGPPADRWNLVITCDGYTQTQINNGDFHTDAEQFKNHFLATPPFDRMAAAINVYRLATWSTDSGADQPGACTGVASTTAATFFDASFCNGNLHHAMWVSIPRVKAAVTAQLSSLRPTDGILVLVNSTDYGGRAEDRVAVATRHLLSWHLAIHEIGHLFNLGEEYDGNGTHGVFEPPYPNLTVATTAAGLKTAWQQLVLGSTPVPTMRTKACNRRFKNPTVGANVIGTFEGGRAMNCGVYRPALTCKMRDITQPFCAVCEAEIERVLTEFLN